jgi:uncharacterized protein (TIGR03435 family)
MSMAGIIHLSARFSGLNRQSRQEGIRVLRACLFCIAAGAFAQSAPPRFETASIRPSNPDELSGASGCETGRGLTRCSNVTLKRAILGAYHVVPDHVLGGPDWIDLDHFQLTGKADQPASGDTLDEMLKILLAERFNLQLHREIRTDEALILELAKKGSKLQAAGAAEQSYSNGHGRLEATAVTISTLAEILSRDTRMTVVDRTGLAGAFTFTLVWNPDAPQDLGPDDAAAFGREALSNAMQQQLGLRLKPQRMPVEMLVIDHADKPTEN